MSIPSEPRPYTHRLFWATSIACLIALLLCAVASVPFFFESASMWYKSGMDGIMLRSGKVVGLLAACLLLLQLLWSARLKVLDQVFGLNALYSIHRILGLCIAGLVIVHPVLVLLSDDMLFIPLQIRYFPELIGLFLALLILGMVLGAVFRTLLGLPYHWWWRLHRLMAGVVPLFLFVHVLFVSETFQSGFPRQLLLTVMGLYVLFYAWVKTRFVRIRRKPYEITAVQPAGQAAHSIRLKPQTKAHPELKHPKAMDYLPGQFTFLTVKSSHIPGEEHPFTIASSPTRPKDLECIIRNSGDWTRKIGNVQPGDRVYLDGPYGLFTHRRLSPDREIIMIAGGIGITPMLSMLRFIADTQDTRPITLIWSNKTPQHIIHPQEIHTLQAQLPQLRICHVFTAQPEGQRLDKARLAELLDGCSLQAAVFVCGPPKMMNSMQKALKGIGYPRRALFMERFSL
ncbi:MAG: FAD-binding oxidoreductase [Desulfovermiculus sp.]